MAAKIEREHHVVYGSYVGRHNQEILNVSTEHREKL